MLMGTTSEPFVCVCVCGGGGGGRGEGGMSKYSASRRGFLQSPLVGITVYIQKQPCNKTDNSIFKKNQLVAAILKI